jgi:hypothetical protein
MSSLWWLALPVLLLPVWWHRQKREQLKAEPLATARFLPRAQPHQVRVWRWADILLLLVRCLLLACTIAWLADPVLPWRGDTVLVAPGADAAWAEREIAKAGFGKAQRMALPAPEGLHWLRAHEREWQRDARLLVVGDVPMPAALPQFGHRVELRSQARPFAESEYRVAIVSTRAPRWRALFAALDGPRRYLVQDAPNGKTDLLIWDVAELPPANLRAPLWWIGHASVFPELRQAPVVDGIRYADSTRGRLWSSDAWPPLDADGARRLFETWQRQHFAPVTYTAPSQLIGAVPAMRAPDPSGALRDLLMKALVALFALERIVTHARRR